MGVTIQGYSERGMITALCYDIASAAESSRLLAMLLSLVRFPLCEGAPPNFQDIRHAEMFIEQSFSDYGDPDLVLLVETADNKKHLIFIEAKVHTDVNTGQTIVRRWEYFQAYLDGTNNKGSALFAQMYRKQRLARQLNNPDEKLSADRVSRRWSLGRNRVVRRAAERLRPYAQSVWVIALLPEPENTIDDFFRKTLARTGFKSNL